MVKTDCLKNILKIINVQKVGTAATLKANPESGCINLCVINQTEAITPYIHAMSNHVGGYIRIHSSILPFTQRGLLSSNVSSK